MKSSASLRRLRERNERLVNRAKALCTRRADGGFDEEELLQKMIAVAPLDIDDAQRRHAKTIIDSATRPGGITVDGQLCLPGFDPRDFEPNLLVRDNDGHIYENHRKVLGATVATAQRARRHVNDAVAESNIKSAEADWHGAWVVEQLSKGRPAHELTWGNCVRETGLWRSESGTGT